MLEDTSVATDLVAAGKHFTDLVLSGNRIKYTASAFDIWKVAVQEADFPEVAVVQAGMGLHDRIDCTDTMVAVKYEVWVTTGEQPLDRLFDVQWAVFRCLLNWDATLKDALTWQSEKYVRNCELLTTEDSLLNKRLNRAIKGWSSVWAGEVWCHFNHDNLIG